MSLYFSILDLYKTLVNEMLALKKNRYEGVSRIIMGASAPVFV